MAEDTDMTFTLLSVTKQTEGKVSGSWIQFCTAVESLEVAIERAKATMAEAMKKHGISDSNDEVWNGAWSYAASQEFFVERK